MAARSNLDKGLDAFSKRQWKRARRLLEDSSDWASASGDYHLGLLYWRGLGGEQDQQSAASCFARAAEEGHSAAQLAFGVALAKGAGVKRDGNMARSLFRSSAGAGNVRAMVQLAALSNEQEARYWLLRAVEHGHAPAMRALGELLIRDDPENALSWFYAHVALTGDHDTIRRAKELARELTADEIAEAQKTGRAFVRNARDARKER